MASDKPSDKPSDKTNASRQERPRGGGWALTSSRADELPRTDELSQRLTLSRSDDDRRPFSKAALA